MSSVERLLQKIQQLTARPVPDFSKYEALALVEALKNAASDVKNEQAGYYKLAYETLRGKISEPDEIFRNYLLPLLGDKDQEKITTRSWTRTIAERVVVRPQRQDKCLPPHIRLVGVFTAIVSVISVHLAHRDGVIWRDLQIPGALQDLQILVHDDARHATL